MTEVMGDAGAIKANISKSYMYNVAEQRSTLGPRKQQHTQVTEVAWLAACMIVVCQRCKHGSVGRQEGSRGEGLGLCFCHIQCHWTVWLTHLHVMLVRQSVTWPAELAAEAEDIGSLGCKACGRDCKLASWGTTH